MSDRLTRWQLFQLWYQLNDLKPNERASKQIMTSRTALRQEALICCPEIEGKIIKMAKNMHDKFRKAWASASRTMSTFKENLANFFSNPNPQPVHDAQCNGPITEGGKQIGRPLKAFHDLKSDSKTKKVGKWTKTVAAEEIVWAATVELNKTGKRSAASVLQKVDGGDAKKMKKAIEKAEEQVLSSKPKMSPLEVSNILLLLYFCLLRVKSKNLK